MGKAFTQIGVGSWLPMPLYRVVRWLSMLPVDVRRDPSLMKVFMMCRISLRTCTALTGW